MDDISLSKIALYNSLHSSKYTYPDFKYISCLEKFKVICDKHGLFYTYHSAHGSKRKPIGCPTCSGAKIKLTFQVWKQKSSIIHNEFYTYLDGDYNSTQSIVSIVCPIHGVFQQKAGDHLRGAGCRSCQYVNNSIRRKKTLEEFVKQADSIHFGKYDYSKFVYINNKKASTVICKNCTFEWLVRPDNHLHEGTGCPKCAKTGIYGRAKNKDISYSDMDCVLYFIRLFNSEENFLKIGLTAESINRRFSMLPYEFEVIKYFNLKLDKARVIESDCFKKFSDCKYIPKIPFSGKTECFNFTSLDEIENYLNATVSPTGS